MMKPDLQDGAPDIREVRLLQSELNGALGRLTGHSSPPIYVTMWMSDSEVVVAIQLPEIDPATLELEVEGQTLKLHAGMGRKAKDDLLGGASAGPLERAIPIPVIIQPSEVKATWSEGLLIVRLARPRQVH